MSFFKSLPRRCGCSPHPDAQSLGRTCTGRISHCRAAQRRAAEAAVQGTHRGLRLGLYACQYCFGVHAETAKAFGMEAGTLGRLLTDINSADVDDRLKPLLHYARKLTLEPSHMTEADAQAVFAAGWSEAALHEAVLTVCLFNFMNRLLEGHGVKGNPGVFTARGQALRAEWYAPSLAFLDAAQPPGSTV